MFGIFNRKRKPAIDEALLVRDARFVVMDTELTGLDEKKDSIVSIGAVRMTGGTIALGNPFYRLASPRTELKADSVCIHEIMPSDCVEQPGIEAVLDEFLDYIGNDAG